MDEKEVAAVVKAFAANWRDSIQRMNANVMSSFSSFRGGMELLKAVLTQLLLYYTRLGEVIRKAFSTPPACTAELVSTQTFLAEIKKYSKAF